MIALALSARRCRSHIGFTEFIAFCVVRRRRLIALDRYDTFDFVSAMAPQLTAADWSVEPFRIRVVFCKKVDNVWQLAGHGEARHFMAAIPLAEGPAVAGPGHDDLGGLDVITACRRIGFAVFPTVDDGDCGPDTLNIVEGLPRILPNRHRVRNQTHDVLVANAASPQWHETFRAAQ